MKFVNKNFDFIFNYTFIKDLDNIAHEYALTSQKQFKNDMKNGFAISKTTDDAIETTINRHLINHNKRTLLKDYNIFRDHLHSPIEDNTTLYLTKDKNEFNTNFDKIPYVKPVYDLLYDEFQQKITRHGFRVDGVVNTDRLVEDGDDTKVPSFRLFKEVQSTIYQGMSELETEIQDGIQEAKDYTDQVATNLEVDISADVTAECNTYTDQQISIAVTNCNETAVAAAEAAGTAVVIEANAYALSINTTTNEYVNNEINAIAGDMIEKDTYDYDSGLPSVNASLILSTSALIVISVSLTAGLMSIVVTLDKSIPAFMV
ncbi:hypothetical protein QTN25_008639 [Entamoeba marina]